MTTFEWNNQKATSNKRKHGVSFEEAQSVFYDDFAIQFFDTENSDDEERFSCLVKVIYQGFYWCVIAKKMKVKSFE